MTDGSDVFGLIFGGTTPSRACISCSGIGLTGIGDGEIPALCERCGGGFDAPIFDPDFVARCRPSMTEAELDEEAQAFGKALLDALRDLEDRVPD